MLLNCCVWRRLFGVPWTARRSYQSILKEISPEYSLEGLMLKLKLQNFGHLMWRTNSLEKTLVLGKIEGRRRRGWQRMRWLDDITDSMDNEFEQAAGGDAGQGKPGVLQSMRSRRVRHDWGTELADWPCHLLACCHVSWQALVLSFNWETPVFGWGILLN